MILGVFFYLSDADMYNHFRMEYQLKRKVAKPGEDAIKKTKVRDMFVNVILVVVGLYLFWCFCFYVINSGWLDLGVRKTLIYGFHYSEIVFVRK